VATGPDTFEFRFSAPFAPLLGRAGRAGTPLFIMREKEASTDVNTQIAEVGGSGPFLFVKEEWVPGAKAVYRKNSAYVPRSDPPDGFAGAKIAKVDRVEWLYLPDPNTATSGADSR
jgi:peptide/nickel transport system substrate-binding protein